MSRSQITKKLSIGAAIIVLIFISILTFGNLDSFDEPLSPEVKAALAPIKMPEDKTNAFIGIWGFTAKSGEDIFSAGRAMIDRYRHNREIKKQDELTQQDYQSLLADNQVDKHWQSAIDQCHVRKNQDCTIKLAASLLEQPIESKRFQEMLSRYQLVRSLKNYQHFDDLTFASPLPSFGPYLSVSKINHAMHLNQGNADVFIENIQQELAFWRMMLVKGDTILDKMIANAGYRISLSATSNFLANKPSLNKIQINQLKWLLSPLTQEELDISEAFIFEEKAFYNTLKNMDAEQLEDAFGLASTPAAWLVQINATMNDYHELFVAKIEQLGELSTEPFAQAIQPKGDGSCCFQELESLSSISFSALYNLGGKTLLTTSLFSAEDYLARIHDLNGIIGLVGIQLETGGDSTLVESKLKQSNIILGHRVRFDSNEKSLGFSCLDKHSICKILL